MLSNFQLGGQALLQIFLLGQPEFRDLMQSPGLEQLRQRVIATHHLDPMLASEVGPYVEHRLGLAGWQGNPRFTSGAYAALHMATAGVPRRINALMSRVLLLGAIDKLDEIDTPVIDAVVAELSQENEAQASPPAPSAPVARAAAAPQAASAHPVEMSAVVQPSAPPADREEVARLRAEIGALRAAIDGQQTIDLDLMPLIDRVDALEDRLHAVESVVGEQDVALRRVLAMLVEWIERDEAAGLSPHGQAA
jgi:hypothetical protein